MADIVDDDKLYVTRVCSVDFGKVFVLNEFSVISCIVKAALKVLLIFLSAYIFTIYDNIRYIKWLLRFLLTTDVTIKKKRHRKMKI